MANKNKQATEEFSQENKNLEVIPSAKKDKAFSLAAMAEEAVELSPDKIDVKKGGNIVIGSMNVVINPVKEHLKKRHEKFYRESKFHLWADISFALIILALAASFIIFHNFKPKAEIAFKTVLAGGGASSGQAETFEISYKNNGKIDIKDSTLSLSFPANFALLSVSPEKAWSDQTNTFKIGDLPHGANGEVSVTGVPFGEIGVSQILAFSLNYLENGRQGNNLGSFVFPLDSSALNLVFDAPAEIYKDIDFGGKITVTNESSADIEKEISLNFASSPITIKSISSARAALVNGVIVIDGLKAKEKAEIEYEAASGAAEGRLSAVLSAYLDLDGRKVKQTEAARNFLISSPKFSVIISTDKKSIAGEEAVGFKLNFANKENSDLSNVTINITPSDSAVAIKSFSLKSGADKYKTSGSVISLGGLGSGAAGEINFEAVLSRKAISADQETGVTANINYQLGERAVEYKIFSPKLKFLSDLQIGSKGLYYSAQGDQLGVGPIPPVVDVPTHYWIFWEINNLGNDLKNLSVSADLPSRVGWTEQKSLVAGNIRYGEISRKVVWTVEDVASSGGNYRVGFEISLIPSRADLGKVPPLVTNIRYSATDIFAGEEISGTLPDINANLKDDPTASGKGSVVWLNVVK
jgi:hypothetical protein